MCSAVEYLNEGTTTGGYSPERNTVMTNTHNIQTSTVEEFVEVFWLERAEDALTQWDVLHSIFDKSELDESEGLLAIPLAMEFFVLYAGFRRLKPDLHPLQASFQWRIEEVIAYYGETLFNFLQHWAPSHGEWLADLERSIQTPKVSNSDLSTELDLLIRLDDAELVAWAMARFSEGTYGNEMDDLLPCRAAFKKHIDHFVDLGLYNDLMLRCIWIAGLPDEYVDLTLTYAKHIELLQEQDDGLEHPVWRDLDQLV